MGAVAHAPWPSRLGLLGSQVASRGPRGPAGDVFISIHFLSRSQGPAGDASRGPQGPAGDVFTSILQHFSSFLHLHPSLRKPLKGLFKASKRPLLGPRAPRIGVGGLCLPMYTPPALALSAPTPGPWGPVIPFAKSFEGLSKAFKRPSKAFRSPFEAFYGL